MRKNILIVISIIVVVLLVFSQIMWVQLLIKRDKERFEIQLKQTLQNITSFCLSKAISSGLDELSFEIIPVEPDEIKPDAVVRGSFDTKEYKSDKNLGNFLVGTFAEDQLDGNKIPLEPIDSLFRKEFAHYDEIAAYSMSIQKKDSAMRELRVGEKAETILKDTTSGVIVEIPLGRGDAYSYKAHVAFKPTIFTQRLRSVATLSALAVVLISLLLLYQLLQLRRKTEELDAHKRAVRGIVHDLKSPLSYIYTLLGILEKNEPVEVKKEMFSTSKTRVKYLSDKIEMLLSAIKSNNKKLQIDKKSYPVADRCNEIMKELKVIYSAKKIYFSIEPEIGCSIQADPIYFDACVRNLLDNAVKYSECNPRIKVSCMVNNKQQMLLSFADNGKGIPMAEQKNIFKEFYRSNAQSSLKNHGVGLAFTKQIIHAHSGKLLIESTEGKGSIFTIILPQ
ncbi:MAG: HAMP domain-containing sensor histidine kinase [Dysgonamonadaceae bacterium]